MDLAGLFSARVDDKYDLHSAHLNGQFVRVLKTIGFENKFIRGTGQYLFDDKGQRFLDLLSGFGVFAIGRNHPTVVDALGQVLASELPNLVQMDVSVLSGVLAERLLPRMAGLDKMFFCNSGAEAVEAAIKFSRAATGRSRILHCDHAFHGLSCGALSLNGDQIFRGGFGPLLEDADSVPFNDLPALERALSKGDVAAFFVEPIQGKGVNMPSDNYLAEAARLCRQKGALFVADEIQTGMGRTGRFLAIEHWGVEPDMVLLAKALSGGFVPVGAVATRRKIFEKVFDRMDRAVVHGSTFGKNDLAMAAGIATLEVIDNENLVARAASMGDSVMSGLREMGKRHQFVADVRGKGLMIGIEFGPPKSLGLRAGWEVLERASPGLFCQMVTIPLFKRHRVLCQVAGHGLRVVKLIPPLIISDEDRDWIVDSFDDVIAECHRLPGGAWDLARTLAGAAVEVAFAKA